MDLCSIALGSRQLCSLSTAPTRRTSASRQRVRRVSLQQFILQFSHGGYSGWVLRRYSCKRRNGNTLPMSGPPLGSDLLTSGAAYSQLQSAPHAGMGTELVRHRRSGTDKALLPEYPAGSRWLGAPASALICSTQVSHADIVNAVDVSQRMV